MRRSLVSFMFALVILSLASAQDYKTGIGVRAGFSSGLTVKHFTSQNIALEGLFTTRWQGFVFTGLYEVQNRAFDVKRLNWYYGGGAHLGFYNGSYAYWGDRGTAYTVIGIDGIIGMEYNFDEIPINIGVDWKPALNFIGYTGFWSEGAISIRYIF